MSGRLAVRDTLTRITKSDQRPIGLVHATAMVAGIIIGGSIFVQPSEINRHVPTPLGVVSVWLAAGILTLFGSLVCADLSRALPRTGGVYVFLKETLSPGFGFLWGWAMFWSAHSGIIAASSVVFARYVAYFIPLNDTGIHLVAIGGILLLTAVNYSGVRMGSIFQTAVTASKVGIIVLLLAIIFLFTHPGARSTQPSQGHGFGEFILGISAALFAFGGWHMVTYTAGETRNPERTLPRALLTGAVIVTACYVALNAAYLRLLPIERVIHSKRVAADAAEVVAGPLGGEAIAALVILSVTGVLNGVILAGPRTYFAMAQEGLTFRWLGTIRGALITQAVWSCVLVMTGTYQDLFTRVIYTEWIFFALMAVGLMRLRKRFMLIPTIFAAAALLVAFVQIAADPAKAATGLGLILLGLPVYLLWHTPVPKATPANGFSRTQGV